MKQLIHLALLFVLSLVLQNALVTGLSSVADPSVLDYSVGFSLSLDYGSAAITTWWC